jgi:hypothetical protein
VDRKDACLMRTNRLFPTLRYVVVAAALSPTVFAQTTTARLTGVVRDPSGAVVPNAEVTITSQRTGQSRTVTTNADGLFVAVSLSPAAYDVVVKATGFSSTEAKNLLLVVGQELGHDFSLPLAGAEASVTVESGAASALDTSSARVGANVPSREVEQLPINGRQVSQLYLLAPGATNAGSGTFDNIHFSGRSVEQNIIRLDGIEATSIIDTSPGNLGEVTSAFRLQQSLEAVQEFRVDSSSYPAELGTGTGGQISFVTKSGGNAWHGSIFDYLRNDFFDARNTFNRRATAGNNTRFRLNQFGGSVGGPLIKDKLFVFATYEGLRQGYDAPYTESTLSNYARQRVASTSPALVGLLSAFPADPFPLAVGVNQQTVTTVGNNKITEDFGDIRFDYHINQRFSMYARYNRDQGKLNQTQNASLSQFNQNAVPQNAVIALNQVLSSRMFNETKFGFNSAKARPLGTSGPSPNADLSRAQIAIAGLTTPGSLIRLSSSFNGIGSPYTSQSYSYIDNFSFVQGNHNMKFGVEIRPISLYNNLYGGTTYTFNSIDNFVTNRPDVIQFYGDLSDPSPFTGLSGIAQVKQNYLIGYAQDEWKLSPELTLSYGLRYEYYTPLHEVRNKNVVFSPETGTITPRFAGDWYKTSVNNYGPRLGLAYAPRSLNNQTIFRIGGGVFFGPGQTEDQIQPEANDRVSRTFSSAPGTVYPINPQNIIATFDINSPTLGYQPRAYTAHYTIPERVVTYTASVQQQLPGGFQAMIGYVGSTSRNLFQRSITNLITNVATNSTSGAAITTRQFGGRFAEIDIKSSGGTDQYHALQSTLQRRYASGLSLGAQYTWAKELGTSSGSNEATTSQIPFGVQNAKSEYGRGTFDIRHSMNVTALYDLPIGKGKAINLSGPVAAVLGDWQVGSVVNFRSGVPIDVLITRPDVAYVGVSGSPYAGQVFSNPVLNPSCPAFTTNGSLIGPGVCTAAVINTPGGGNTRNIRRPNRVPGVSPYLKQGKQFLNPAAFSTPAPGTFGNSRRNDLSGPILSQLDLTLAKTLKFTERVNLKFQADAYNVLNHPNYANPGVARLAQTIPSTATGAGIQPGVAFTTATAGGNFGTETSTVGNQVGLGANRQIQLSLRLSY